MYISWMYSNKLCIAVKSLLHSNMPGTYNNISYAPLLHPLDFVSDILLGKKGQFLLFVAIELDYLSKIIE